ncbi:hypothetical protein NPIL_609751 [Nephila pilipes]|uniref:Uncharacterized protein n=1 Tax=Nephila pilipes TaxID=299642 RepID=A0A8X6N176_NEPPI|nr:hypothetical protein NPIL_609751 [Nephila pilipes]
METIYYRFPLKAGLHSELEMNGVADAGIYCEHFTQCPTLGTAKSAFDGEAEAIKEVLTHLNARPLLSDQTVIFSRDDTQFWPLPTTLKPLTLCP